MAGLSLSSQVGLYVMLALMALFVPIVWVWQIMVLKGKAMKNPDGSSDSWREQKSHYGMAFADVFLACPAVLAGVILVIAGSRWGYYLLALCGFWFVWANIMTTATSLRFEKPRINAIWFLTFPFGILLGLAYIVWTFFNFDTIYLP